MADPVFINCPFDTDYTPKFRAMVFTIIYCGFEPRCALEVDNAAENRLGKIMRIIGECGLSVHDISRTQLDSENKLPRFNMPFELGIVFGAKNFGGKKHARKSCLIVDTAPFRYQKFLSDIAGQDIQAHADDYRELIGVVRNWLSQSSKRGLLPGDQAILDDFEKFVVEFPQICSRAGITTHKVTYSDFTNIVKAWIAKIGGAA